MTHQLTTSAQAQDPKVGMTLGELAAFVQTALRLDLERDTPITVSIGWRTQIQRITATGTTEEDDPR